MPEEKPNIYPPTIIDPLLPGGTPPPPDESEKPVEVLQFAPCPRCERYTVMLGGHCPGCGAVR